MMTKRFFFKTAKNCNKIKLFQANHEFISIECIAVSTKKPFLTVEETVVKYKTRFSLFSTALNNKLSLNDVIIISKMYALK